LPDDAVAPKTMLLEVIDTMRETQRRIAMINAEAQIMQQKAQQFLMEDVDGQASQMVDAAAQVRMQQASQEQLPDDELAEEETEIE
jgi:hypothetical protein